eukprot:scaffold884_cov398-Prasinococcus_capsulatus_cf.AAC.4
MQHAPLARQTTGTAGVPSYRPLAHADPSIVTEGVAISIVVKLEPERRISLVNDTTRTWVSARAPRRASTSPTDMATPSHEPPPIMAAATPKARAAPRITRRSRVAGSLPMNAARRCGATSPYGWLCWRHGVRRWCIA